MPSVTVIYASMFVRLTCYYVRLERNAIELKFLIVCLI